jgi:hypothetical protein
MDEYIELNKGEPENQNKKTAFEINRLHQLSNYEKMLAAVDVQIKELTKLKHEIILQIEVLLG